MLRAGERKTYTELIARREHPVLRPTVDGVLLSDGTFFGKNQSNWLGEFKTQLLTSYNLKAEILARLEAEGLEPVLASLRPDRVSEKRNLEVHTRVRRPSRPQ